MVEHEFLNSITVKILLQECLGRHECLCTEEQEYTQGKHTPLLPRFSQAPEGPLFQFFIFFHNDVVIPSTNKDEKNLKKVNYRNLNILIKDLK